MHPVAYGVIAPVYNTQPPFHPDTRYPELPFAEVSASPNQPYDLLRRLFVSLALDLGNFGGPRWNPLGHLIQPGQTVLLKPNFVASCNPSGHDLFAVVSHPSLLRALVDYAYIALRGKGRIIIADAPEMGCQWDDLMAAERLDTIQAWYRERFKFEVEYHDLRNFAMRDPHQTAFASNRVPRPGDPAGHTLINLGRRSAFYGFPSHNYYGADYDRKETIRHHHDDIHEYTISNTFLRADVVISVPKMKVHKKVGVTLNLKGLVGANTNKNCLIHYRVGSPSRHGDQLPDGLAANDRVSIRIQRWLLDRTLARQSRVGDTLYATWRAIYKCTLKPFLPISQETRAVDGGNWHGNDSAWRMTADLAKILFFADVKGTLQGTQQRKIFCVVDGIVGGEKLGPLAPDAKPCGCLIAGEHPMAVDMVTTRLMGFDPRKLRQFDIVFDKAWDFGLHSWSEMEVRCGEHTILGEEFFAMDQRERYFGFVPHPGWAGHVEV
ncbi:MAG: DUF362 domain-containing protein [Planctomycetota bacterium]|nr:DUF362 domain-containing protein [Planctomycetota bacterium]